MNHRETLDRQNEIPPYQRNMRPYRRQGNTITAYGKNIVDSLSEPFTLLAVGIVSGLKLTPPDPDRSRAVTHRVISFDSQSQADYAERRLRKWGFEPEDTQQGSSNE